VTEIMGPGGKADPIEVALAAGLLMLDRKTARRRPEYPLSGEASSRQVIAAVRVLADVETLIHFETLVQRAPEGSAFYIYVHVKGSRPQARMGLVHGR